MRSLLLLLLACSTKGPDSAPVELECAVYCELEWCSPLMACEEDGLRYYETGDYRYTCPESDPLCPGLPPGPTMDLLDLCGVCR